VKNNNVIGYLFVSPWILGFLLFTGGPIIASFVISTYDWNLLSAPSFVGLENYNTLIHDPLFFQSMKVTILYTLGSVPLVLTAALLVAMLLNQKVKGIGLFRTIFYLPTVVAGVAVSLLWSWIFNPDFGLLNQVLGWVGIEGPKWLFDENWALPSLIIMSIWGFGGAMVIFLAGLQDVPVMLYEAAEIDGASRLGKFWHVTLPMISPVILFNSVMGVIGSFQVFTQAYVMTEGGPNNATLLMVLYIYQNGFKYFKMGYASALSVVLFVIILAITLLQFRLSQKHVHYDK
jgi:multiple sugar transport system permease protein